MKYLNKYKHILVWLPFSVFLSGFGIFFISSFYGPYYKYWKNQISPAGQERTIESSIGNLEYEAYKDYFYENSFNKFLTYKISSNIRTNDSSLVTKKAVELAFQYAAEQTLQENEYPLQQLFQQNIILNCVQYFISHLQENGIGTGKFRIDLNFSPYFEQNLNYHKELSTSRLVNLNKFDLKEELYNEEQTILQSVIDSKIATNYKRYQYNGGIISFTIDLDKIKSEKKEFQIKFSRYFRANKLTKPDVAIRSNNLKFSMFHLVSTNIAKHNYITVDLYKNVSLDDGKSKNKKVILNFGKILPTDERQSDVKEKNYTTGSFFIHGKYTDDNVVLKTKIKLEKLVYSFEEKKFTNDSQFLIQIDNRNPASMDKEQRIFNIKNIFLKDSAEKIIKKLNLEKFIYDNSINEEEIL